MGTYDRFSLANSCQKSAILLCHTPNICPLTKYPRFFFNLPEKIQPIFSECCVVILTTMFIIKMECKEEDVGQLFYVKLQTDVSHSGPMPSPLHCRYLRQPMLYHTYLKLTLTIILTLHENWTFGPEVTINRRLSDLETLRITIRYAFYPLLKQNTTIQIHTYSNS